MIPSPWTFCMPYSVVPTDMKILSPLDAAVPVSVTSARFVTLTLGTLTENGLFSTYPEPFAVPTLLELVAHGHESQRSIPARQNPPGAA